MRKFKEVIISRSLLHGYCLRVPNEDFKRCFSNLDSALEYIKKIMEKEK